jgi:cell wall-associated NlpC family hydrolase
MPPRFRTLVPAFALAASVFGCAAAAPLGPNSAVAGPARVGSATVATAIERLQPDPRRYALKPAPQPTVGQRAATIALEAVGVPYRWGGSSLASGFDCSGLVYWAYGRLGVEVPHSSYALYEQGWPVARSGIKAGDVLFFSGLGHVGLYLGGGRMVHAPQSGRLVEVVRLDRSSYGDRLVGARRIVPS